MTNNRSSKKILLALCGGVALINLPSLVRKLQQQGHQLKIIVSPRVKEFINPQLFTYMDIEVISDENYYTSGIKHIELARFADLIMLIPATANTIAKLATGIADNLLLSTLLASNCPTKIIIPAMNSVMWSNPIIQEKVNRLCQLGYECWGPDYGVQLCGEIGYGNLITNEQILANLTAKFMSSQSDKLANYHFVVSGGGTREYLDPVRYLSNHSSGKMALAVVNNLIAHGAKVTFILGSNALNLQQLNPKIKLVLVDTAETMLNAVLNNLTPQSIFIAIAAVCDYKPKNYSTHKLKKNASEPILELIKNVDILAKVRQTYPQLCMVGFACETENLTQYLEQKFYAKQLNLIVGNQVTNDNPIFNHDDNQVVLFDGKNFEEHQLANKDVIAQAIITKLEQILCI